MEQAAGAVNWREQQPRRSRRTGSTPAGHVRPMSSLLPVPPGAERARGLPLGAGAHAGAGRRGSGPSAAADLSPAWTRRRGDGRSSSTTGDSWRARCGGRAGLPGRGPDRPEREVLCAVLPVAEVHIGPSTILLSDAVEPGSSLKDNWLLASQFLLRSELVPVLERLRATGASAILLHSGVVDQHVRGAPGRHRRRPARAGGSVGEEPWPLAAALTIHDGTEGRAAASRFVEASASIARASVGRGRLQGRPRRAAECRVRRVPIGGLMPSCSARSSGVPLGRCGGIQLVELPEQVVVAAAGRRGRGPRHRSAPARVRRGTGRRHVDCAGGPRDLLPGARGRVQVHGSSHRVP